MTTTQFTPNAYITLSNCGGIEIMVNHSGDGVSYRFNYGQDNLQDEEIFESEILYSDEEDHDGEAYFIHNKGRGKVDTYTVYYLSEAMRIK